MSDGFLRQSKWALPFWFLTIMLWSCQNSGGIVVKVLLLQAEKFGEIFCIRRDFPFLRPRMPKKLALGEVLRGKLIFFEG